MAYAFMRTMVQTRSQGHTATGAVCYRMGLAAASTIPGADGLERRFDYTRRTGILATGWAAPPETDASWGDPLTWARRIEAADQRKNSRQCRDDIVGIPVELVEAGAAEEAVQAYAARLAEEHNTVVHWARHAPDRGGKNHHAHVLYPGRHVEGMAFARKRDRTQDNPSPEGGPDLITQHKAIWSEVCRGRGIELDWTSEAPGHHLGPALCAIKRNRLVGETRETIRETVAASTPGEGVPGERTLQAVAEIATRVNDGLTVREMLERELEEVLHGRAAPRQVPAPTPFQPEVLPPVRRTEVLPPMKRAPEVLPPARIAPEVLPPRRPAPQVLPPARRPEVLPPARRQAAVFPPREVATGIIAERIHKQYPGQTAATWSAVERDLEQQRQTLAHERARAAVRKRSEHATKRERAAGSSASANRIRRIADWVLDCAREVLERLGLKPAAAPEHEDVRDPVPPVDSPPPPQPQPEPTLWERYEARWPQHAAADRAVLEDLTENRTPKTLGYPVRGVDGWWRVLREMFQADPKPLPRSLAPVGEASPDAAVDAKAYAGSLPSWRRADSERIVERSREAAEKVRQTLRYRLAGDERRQTLEDDAIRGACGEDAQRLDRKMRAEHRQWRSHWDVLERHNIMLGEEKREREAQRRREQLERLEKSSRTTPVQDRGDPGRTM